MPVIHNLLSMLLKCFVKTLHFFREIYVYWKDIIVFIITNFMKIMISEIKNAAAHNEKVFNHEV